MSGFTLKIIALLTMLIDHIGAVLWYTADFREIAGNMRIIGRISFPIYAFLIAEGMIKTRNQKKYLFRLFLFSIISFIPYSLFINLIINGPYAAPKIFYFGQINVFFTLGIGAFAIYFYDILRIKMKGKKYLFIPQILTVIISVMIADLINTDYGGLGVLVIFFAHFVMSITHEPYKRYLSIVPFLIWCFMLYGISVYLYTALGACLLILSYNGKAGSEKLRKVMKWVFYTFYPVHITILYLLSLTLR